MEISTGPGCETHLVDRQNDPKTRTFRARYFVPYKTVSPKTR